MVQRDMVSADENAGYRAQAPHWVVPARHLATPVAVGAWPATQDRDNVEKVLGPQRRTAPAASEMKNGNRGEQDGGRRPLGFSLMRGFLCCGYILGL
jgi:hypothetical protein